MPITKSAKKAARVSERRRSRNKSARSQVKTRITKAEGLIFAGDAEAAAKAVAEATSTLDKASEKGILHPKNTARRKSRLVKKLNRARAAQAPSAPAKS